MAKKAAQKASQNMSVAEVKKQVSKEYDTRVRQNPGSYIVRFTNKMIKMYPKYETIIRSHIECIHQQSSRTKPKAKTTTIPSGPSNSGRSDSISTSSSSVPKNPSNSGISSRTVSPISPSCSNSSGNLGHHTKTDFNQNTKKIEEFSNPAQKFISKRKCSLSNNASNSRFFGSPIIVQPRENIQCFESSFRNMKISSAGTPTKNFLIDLQTSHSFDQSNYSLNQDSGNSARNDGSSHISFDYQLLERLRADEFKSFGDSSSLSPIDEDIKHAPLISGKVINSSKVDLLPQYGYIGNHISQQIDTSKSYLFLNTNVPFSAFVCGVQGSGKSHTTSCILENAVLRSKYTGVLKSPLSALIFSYAKLNSTGPSFNVSEATFLSNPHPDFPDHQPVRITVLVPSSNPAIARIYKTFPNVNVLPFKLKTQSLDINTMLMMMAVDESANPPLYLASVTKILRQMASEGEGSLDYQEFKKRLKLCDFNPAQTNMLELRLDLLESFLDIDNTNPEIEFRSGEITIMDMSCPFIDANTACILFNVALNNYLNSESQGKMIVLDEAHKYMLDVPGARSLNENLLSIIRQQRHFGTRVVISTQEPGIFTDLIPLCSITIIHRFSSPGWFDVIKKNISVSKQDEANVRDRIETLRTGTALIYSPTAVVDILENLSLVKCPGRFLDVKIRRRITADGGQSILSV